MSHNVYLQSIKCIRIIVSIWNNILPEIQVKRKEKERREKKGRKYNTGLERERERESFQHPREKYSTHDDTSRSPLPFSAEPLSKRGNLSVWRYLLLVDIEWRGVVPWKKVDLSWMG